MDLDVKQLSALFRTFLLESLTTPAVAQALWQHVNARDQSLTHDVWQPYNVRDELFRLAAQDSARFIEETIVSHGMGNVNSLYNLDVPSPYALLDVSLRAADPQGLFLEFGVFTGRTIRHIASRVGGAVHGFDSFQGLAEDSGIWGKGGFTTGGALPEVPANVSLHVGWFNQTLPAFLECHPGPVSFVHVDCDTFESALYVLNALSGRMGPGTVIQFDEFFNYPGWKEGEHKAFREFVRAHAATFRFLGYGERASCVAVRIESMRED